MEIYKVSIELVKEIYVITNKFPDCEKYNLISQLRRASVSVASNFAEGYSRNSEKEKYRFCDISRSSLIEIDTQLEIALMLKYVSDIETREISEIINHLFALLSNFMRKLNP